MSTLTRHMIILVLIVLAFLAIWVGTGHTLAQDAPVAVGFTVSCSNPDPSHVTFWVDSEGVDTYTLTTDRPTTIPETFDTHEGHYAIGEIDYSGLGTADVVFTNKDGLQAIYQLNPDYMQYCNPDAVVEVAAPTPEPTAEVPVYEEPTQEPVVVQSTGKVCTIKYPELILVCS